MTYPFVAAPDNWPRGGVAVQAIAIHHAEGGGTVSWLTRDDGNSSHYVVEYTGRVVQMVREDRAAGSINPSLVRTDDDPPFTFENEAVTYGVSANKRALGDDWRNPNAAVIAIEIEGFAKDGPNNVQRKALAALVTDIRSRHPGIPALGHRDWQDYKACPGKRIPWADYGGHGSKPSTGDDSMAQLTITDQTPKMIDIPIGAKALMPDGTDGDYTFTQAYTRFSPYAAGTLRAYYANVDGKVVIRLVSVPAANIKAIPAPTTTAADCSAVEASLATANATIARQGDTIRLIKSKTATYAADIADE
jgi:hypothetical protein